MNLTQAIHDAARGQIIVSNVGRTYSAADLAPITLLGPWAVAFRTGEMTEVERKGTWSVMY
ncbi:hypothetical protein [Paenibacillus abyssi]|uniref:Uncharacterized protein n=1 Tax=Paenibacillus abyssi TaxID=1340531 RepID=A0A917FKG4_9BACL|nr:hypothetical protein [Paenibacillus abyssi]GGF87993.1 hypothetical protein GCM10010916_01640 [Paenibacillus abyssi]